MKPKAVAELADHQVKFVTGLGNFAGGLKVLPEENWYKLTGDVGDVILHAPESLLYLFIHTPKDCHLCGPRIVLDGQLPPDIPLQ